MLQVFGRLHCGKSLIQLSKIITEDGNCSHEINRCLLLERKAMKNSDSVIKSRHITLRKKVCLVKAMIFPVVVYGCESWTIRKADHQRIDGFELWCCKKTLESPLDCKETKPINPKGNQHCILIGRSDAEASIFWSPDMKNQFIGKDPDAGKD